MWATYLVVLPITVDVSKYVPPFLMNQIGEFGPKDLSAFAFPPFPEQIRDYDYLTELANIRDDDIVFGGSIDPSDVVSAMTVVNDVVENYTQAYSDLAPVAQPAEALPSHEAEGLSINEVMYGLMSDGDKLGELTKLVGRLRFAVEGGEEAMAREAESDIIVLSKLLPENHQAPASRCVRRVRPGRAGGGHCSERPDRCRRSARAFRNRAGLLAHRHHFSSFVALVACSPAVSQRALHRRARWRGPAWVRHPPPPRCGATSLP